METKGTLRGNVQLPIIGRGANAPRSENNRPIEPGLRRLSFLIPCIEFSGSVPIVRTTYDAT